MTAHVIALRPRPRPATVPAPRRVPSGSSPVPSLAVPLVLVDWDGVRGLHVAVCERCADCLTSTDLGDVEDWAGAHRCDPVLAVLLAEIAVGRAA